MNPYEAPADTNDAAVTSIRPETESSVLWLAGTIAFASSLIAIVFWFHRLGQAVPLGSWSLMVESLIGYLLMFCACFTVPAVVLYSFAKRLLNRRYRYRSTVPSQVITGLMAAVFFLGMMLSSEAAGESQVYGLALLLGIPFAGLLVIVESRIVGGAAEAREDSALQIQSVAPASILWFSLTTQGVFFLFVGGMNRFYFGVGRTQPLWQFIVGTLSTAAVACFLATIHHAVVCQRPPRSRIPSFRSRIAAAVVFFSVFCMLAWGVSTTVNSLGWGPLGGMYDFCLFVLVLPLIAATCSAAVDRALGDAIARPEL